jgi:hypothetical protein
MPSEDGRGKIKSKTVSSGNGKIHFHHFPKAESRQSRDRKEILSKQIINLPHIQMFIFIYFLAFLPHKVELRLFSISFPLACLCVGEEKLMKRSFSSRFAQ